MKKLLILDTVSLINLLERCVSRDLVKDLFLSGYGMFIVAEVRNEFLEKPAEIGLKLFLKSKENGVIKIIDFDQEEIDVSVLRKLKGLDLGETVSLLFWLKNQDYEFVSDDNAVHKILEREFSLHCLWTTSLLQEMIYSTKFTPQEASAVYQEMKDHGFWGIKNPDFKEK
ncbi:MAG TPA: hypothetical protein PLD62_06650 [Candidatus Cloacimonadota bacterium]|nr:hypothetical protein [Candidatus Cloacimonadota bacterium]